MSCGPDEYFDEASYGCYACHVTCETCDDATPCDLPCHEDCLTCDGPNSDDCVTCYPGAERTNDGAQTSCCQCEQDLYGEPSDCRHVCYDSSCEYCIGPYPHDCLVCAENHEFVYTEDEDAHFCEYCFDNDWKQSVCGPRDITGLRLAELESDLFLANKLCTCEIGEWLHDGKCVACPKGCAECRQSEVHCRAECLACETGYVDHSHMCIEECPTGYYAHSWFESTRCTKTNEFSIFSFTMALGHGFWERSMTFSVDSAIDITSQNL